MIEATKCYNCGSRRCGMIRDPKADSYVCADCLFSERDTLLELTQKYRVTIEDRREDHNKLLAQTAEFAKTILELREQIKELKFQRLKLRKEVVRLNEELEDNRFEG